MQIRECQLLPAQEAAADEWVTACRAGQFLFTGHKKMSLLQLHTSVEL